MNKKTGQIQCISELTFLLKFSKTTGKFLIF